MFHLNSDNIDGNYRNNVARDDTEDANTSNKDAKKLVPSAKDNPKVETEKTPKEFHVL